MKLSRPLVVLDLETTGTWIEKDRIVEIAMVKCLAGGSRELFQRRVNPGTPIPPRVSDLIGITDEDVKGEARFREIAPAVLAFIGDSDLGGFNIDRFDLPLLERELFEVGLKFQWRQRDIYDAQRIYHFHEKRDLKAAYKFYCDKELANAHSALDDAEASLEILQAQIEKYKGPEEAIEALREFRQKKPDGYFDEERKFRWWNGQLYPMFGRYARKRSLREVAQKDPAYLEWMLSSDFSVEVKGLVKDALAGKFPSEAEAG